MGSLEARNMWDMQGTKGILVQKHERKGPFWETRLKETTILKLMFN
jgi:hypothetical protein